MTTNLFTSRQQGLLGERNFYRFSPMNTGFTSGKQILLFLMGICISLMTNAQVSKSVELTPGSLSAVLTTTELGTVTHLTLNGSIDARDFKTMRDEMPKLSELDLSGISIVTYIGDGGTMGPGNFYEANYIPAYLFHNPYTLVEKISLTKVIPLLPLDMEHFGDVRHCLSLTCHRVLSLFELLHSKTVAV